MLLPAPVLPAAPCNAGSRIFGDHIVEAIDPPVSRLPVSGASPIQSLVDTVRRRLRVTGRNG